MQVTIRNNTPAPLELAGVEGRKLLLAPMESRQVSEEEAAAFDLSHAERQGIAASWREPPSETVENILTLATGLGMFLGIACWIAASQDVPEWYGPVGTPRSDWHLFVWGTGFAVLLFAVLAKVIYETKSFQLVTRFLAQAFSLLVILAISVGLPAAAVYYFGDGRGMLETGGLPLFARMLQVMFIAIASLLPTLLFFLFDRYQLNTIRDRLYRDLFRLDRTLKSRSQVDTKYGSQIGEAYGSEAQGRGRLAPGTAGRSCCVRW